LSDELEGGNFSVVEGRDGFLFLGTYEQTDVMGLFTDPGALSPTVQEEWSRALVARREFFEERGTPYVTVVIPDSHIVYADALPAGTTLAPQTPYQRIEALLDDATRAQSLYLLDDLVAGREEQHTFQTTDSHWTDFGAYLGYRRTMNVLRAELPNIEVLAPERLVWTERLSFGALGAVMPEERSERLRVAEVVGSRCRPTRAISTEVRDGYLLVEQDRPDLPTAVVFRDSFMTNAHKFFSESFRRVVYVSNPNQLYFDLVEAEDPDVVIFETVERRLCIPPRDASPSDFRTIFGDLMLDDPEAIRAQVTSRSLLRADDVVGALSANDDALARARPNARLLLYRSRLLARLGNPEAALEALRSAFTFDPRDGQIAQELAQALLRQGRLAEAAAAARWAAEIEPDQVELWSSAISVALEAGDATSACALARKALEHHDDRSVLRYLYSQALVGAGDLGAAETAVREALAARPDDAIYLRQLASVLIRSEQWGEAERCLAHLRGVEPAATDLDAFIDLVDHRLAGGGSAIAP
jgi:tetratricopeptide (TPR) repeat protein